MTKKWYQSKTIGANVIIVLGVVAQVLTGTTIFDPDLQVAIVAIINAVLRFMTKGPIQ